MAVSEQARLATVEEHVRGENARDMDAVMRTVSDSEQASVVYDGIPTRGRAKIRRSYEIRLNALPDFRFEVKQRHFKYGLGNIYDGTCDCRGVASLLISFDPFVADFLIFVFPVFPA